MIWREEYGVRFEAIVLLSLALTPPIFAYFNTYVSAYKYVRIFDWTNHFFLQIIINIRPCDENNSIERRAGETHNTKKIMCQRYVGGLLNWRDLPPYQLVTRTGSGRRRF